MKFRQVLICNNCDSLNTEQYIVSQKRYAQEQIDLINQIISTNPEMAAALQPTLDAWKNK